MGLRWYIFFNALLQITGFYPHFHLSPKLSSRADHLTYTVYVPWNLIATLLLATIYSLSVGLLCCLYIQLSLFSETIGIYLVVWISLVRIATFHYHTYLSQYYDFLEEWKFISFLNRNKDVNNLYDLPVFGGQS